MFLRLKSLGSQPGFTVTCFFHALPCLVLMLTPEVAAGREAAVKRSKKSVPASGHKAKPPLSDEAAPEAQLALAMAYYSGKGVPKDLERASYWFSKAAEQGNAGAQFYLGVFYSTGQGLAQDCVKAVEWFSKAAAQGDTRAWYDLGLIYARGAEGIARDLPRALNCFEKSALSGDPKGQVGLAWFYGDSLGGEPDPVKAYAWACLAAEKDPHGRAIKPLLEQKLSLKERQAAAALVRDLKSQLASGFQRSEGPPKPNPIRPSQDADTAQPFAVQKVSTAEFTGFYSAIEKPGNLLLQETPVGLAYQLHVELTGDPNHSRRGWQIGLARQVCAGVFVDHIVNPEGEQQGRSIQLKFTLEPDGKVRVNSQGLVRSFSQLSNEDIDGVYQKKPVSSQSLDQRFSQATAALKDLDERGSELNAREQLALSERAARLIWGGDRLAAALRGVAETTGKSRSLVYDISRAQNGDYLAMKAVFHWLGVGYGRLRTDPEFALYCYKKGKKNNPDFAVAFESKGQGGNPDDSVRAALNAESAAGAPLLLEISRIAMECGPLDLRALSAKTGMSESSLTASPETLWELAEEASRGGRFGRPNARLALQIIVCAGGELKEIAQAVRVCHDAWKTGNSRPVTLLPLMSRRSPRAVKSGVQSTAPRTAADWEELRRAVGDSAKASFEQASAAALDLIQALSLRFSGDLGFLSWELNRRAFCEARLQDYLKSVREIHGGFSPEDLPNFDAADDEMSQRYNETMLWLRIEKNVFRADESGTGSELFNFESSEHLRDVQRLWIKHRERSAALYHQLNPSLSEEQWRAWLTRARSNELVRLQEQAGVLHAVLNPQRVRQQHLNKEYVELYRKYETLPKDFFSRGRVKPSISNPEVFGKKAVEQLQRLIENEVREGSQISWNRHGAFAQLFRPLAWATLLEQAVNFTEAVLRCNPEELDTDPSGYYEDFEGGVVCVIRDGLGYLISADCQRTIKNWRASLVFSGELREDVVTGESTTSGSPGPRLLVGRGMVCLEPRAKASVGLANTYVRVGVLNEVGCKLVRDLAASQAAPTQNDTQTAQQRQFLRPRLAEVLGLGDKADFVEGFNKAGLKRFGPTRYNPDFQEAIASAKRLLDEAVLKK